jgi:hypothetical protein
MPIEMVLSLTLSDFTKSHIMQDGTRVTLERWRAVRGTTDNGHAGREI